MISVAGFSPESRLACMASMISVAGFRFLNTVGSPIEREIIFLSGQGVMFIVSRMFLIGLKVFLATTDALTFHSRVVRSLWLPLCLPLVTDDPLTLLTLFSTFILTKL